MNYKKLVGEKVYLSPVSHEDWEILAKWGADYELKFLYGGGDDSQPPQTDSSGAESRSKNKNQFAIIDKETDKIIGTCGFNIDDLANRYAKIGIGIGAKEYWSNGYGTDALHVLLHFGFTVRGYNNISLNVYDYNPRAIACYEKVGFKRQGVWRESMIRGEERYDCIHLDYLAEEYFAKH
ncbi:MAG: GNAT family N-acetyltransferase [Defluviitaleaceae bacterium]|nr:GNAT family N-acetyltransferase [Defluviitaleaceae bacterium]